MFLVSVLLFASAYSILQLSTLPVNNSYKARYCALYGLFTGSVLNKLLLLGSLGAVFRAGILSILNPYGVQCSPHHVIPDTREILDTSATNQHDGVFLKVVSNARNIGSHFDPVCKADTRDFSQSRVGLFGSGGVNPRANASALRTPLQSRTLRLITNFFSTRTYQLIEGRQTLFSLKI